MFVYLVSMRYSQQPVNVEMQQRESQLSDHRVHEPPRHARRRLDTADSFFASSTRRFSTPVIVNADGTIWQSHIDALPLLLSPIPKVLSRQ